MTNNESKRGFSGLSNLTTDTDKITQAQPGNKGDRPLSNHKHDSRVLPGESEILLGGEVSKEGSGGFFIGIMKFLLAIPWQLYLVGGVAGYFYFQSEIEDREISSFQSKINYYLAKSHDSKNIPPLTSSVLPIDLGSKTVDSMLFRIRDSYKPKSAEDVSFVVGFNCSDQVVGSYSDGASGYQKSCDIYVIDVHSHTWAYAGNFSGSEPPSSKKGGGSRTGSHPAQDYLRRAGVL